MKEFIRISQKSREKSGRINQVPRKGSFRKRINKRKIIDSQGDGIRCFNCGASGHQARDCDKKFLGKKCFVCNKFGHEEKL